MLWPCLCNGYSNIEVTQLVHCANFVLLHRCMFKSRILVTVSTSIGWGLEDLRMSFVARLYFTIYYPLFNTKPVFLVLNPLCLNGSSSLDSPATERLSHCCNSFFFFFLKPGNTRNFSIFVFLAVFTYLNVICRAYWKPWAQNHRVETYLFSVCTILGYIHNFPCNSIEIYYFLKRGTVSNHLPSQAIALQHATDLSKLIVSVQPSHQGYKSREKRWLAWTAWWCETLFLVSSLVH